MHVSKARLYGGRDSTNEQPRGVWLFEERCPAMRRTEQQPGGVTDAQMLSDPRRSDRDRNWFEVDWNIGSMDVTWLPQRRDIDVQGSVHGLLASRKSLGFLGTPNRVDPGVERDLIWGDFASLGWDVRMTKRVVQEDSDRFSALVLGTQGYLGETRVRVRGCWVEATFGFNPRPPRPESTHLPNVQRVAFAQALLSDHLSITLKRVEGISNFAEDTARSSTMGEWLKIRCSRAPTETSKGALALGWPERPLESEGNAVRTRAVTFSDIQINTVVDPDIGDERGANFDLGYRTANESWTLMSALLPLPRPDWFVTHHSRPHFGGKPVLLRTNLSDARTSGLEFAGRGSYPLRELTPTGSFSAMHSRYAKGSPVIGQRSGIVSYRAIFCGTHFGFVVMAVFDAACGQSIHRSHQFHVHGHGFARFDSQTPGVGFGRAKKVV